jgi:hypothetical protein
MEEEQDFDLAQLKRKLKRKNERIRVKNKPDENNEDGSKRNIFEVDFTLVKSAMNPDLLSQLRELLTGVEHNHTEYLHHLIRLKGIDESSVPKGTKVFIPKPLDVDQLENVQSTGIDIQDLKADEMVFWTHECPAANSQVLPLLNELKKLTNCNLSSIAKNVRKLSVCYLIIMSPFMMQEMNSMFSEWLKEFKDLILTKFCRNAQEAAEEREAENEKEASAKNVLADENNGSIDENDDEELLDTTLMKPKQTTQSAYLGSTAADMDEELPQDFFINFSYKQNIRIGGIAKQLLALWTADEIFEGIVFMYYWLIGLIRLRDNHDHYIFECQGMGDDTNLQREDFLRICEKSYTDLDKNSYIPVSLAKTTSLMIWNWIETQNKLFEDLRNPKIFDIKKYKVECYKIQKLLEVRRSPFDLFARMDNTVIGRFGLLEKRERGNNFFGKIVKSSLNDLILAENHHFCFNPRDVKTRYYCGKENYFRVAPFEVTKDEVEYWLLANSLTDQYVPLVPTADHFTNSVFELNINYHLKSKSKVRPINTSLLAPVSLVKEMICKTQVDEICLEIETLLSLLYNTDKKIYQGIVTSLLEEKYILCTTRMIEQARLLVDNLNILHNSIDACPLGKVEAADQIKFKIRTIVTRLLNNEIEDPNCISAWIHLIMNEYWIEFTQRIDSSYLLEKSIKPQVEQLEAKLVALQKDLPADLNKPLITNRVVFDATLEDDFPCQITVNKNIFCKRAVFSKQTIAFYKEKLCDNLKELIDSVIVKSNAKKSADKLYDNIAKALEKVTSEGLNEPVPEEYIFKRDPKKGTYKYSLPNPEKGQINWKKVRRFIPELIAEKQELGVPVEVWKKITPFIENSYWKIQCGLATWYALMVDGSPYENEVLMILSKANLGKARTRDAAIKVMSIISEHFKLFTDADYDTKNKEILKVPWWVFSGSDTIFGYTDQDEKECKSWKVDVINSILDWIGKFEPENMAGIDLNYDFEIAMEHFLREFKPTYSPFNLKFSETIERTCNFRSERFASFKPSRKINRIPRDRNYFAKDEDEGMVVLTDFFTWCKSFLKFSVDGAAQGLKIDVDKLYLIPKAGEEAKGTAEASDEEDKKKSPTEAQVSTEFQTPPEPVDLKIDEPKADDAESENLTPMQKAIRKEKKRNPIDDYTRTKSDKTKSLSKTLAFAYGGKHLSRILFWCGGDTFLPELNIHLKIEKKKIRLVANSDIVSFNKQNFLYEWFIKALPDSTKELIYTVIHPRNKVKRVERFQHCFRGEKWLCPMDLKDFQIQFGPVHHRTIMRCFYRRAASITDPEIRKEIEYLCSTLHEELCKGVIFFRNSSVENWKEVKDKIDKSKLVNIKSWIVDEPTNEVEGEAGMDDVLDIGINEPQLPATQISNKYRLFAAFEVKNGLLSGWKVTSAFGSIYNYSTNNLINFWSLFYLGLVPTDYATQGDDTHFKTRFLMGSMFHTAFVNSIGKVAHPKKQFFSTRYTEFLKKTYDIWKKDVRYQPCRIISSLLYDNENRETKSNNRNNLKDLVDLWNQFLVRIPDESRRDYISKVRRYPHNSIRAKFKWYTSKGGHTNHDNDTIEKLLSTPEMINGILSGPLTNPNYLCKLVDPQTKTFKLFNAYSKAEMNDYLIEFQHGLNIAKWNGIRSQVNNISRRLTANKKATFANEQAFRVELSNEMFKAIGESLTEYTKPEILGTIATYPMPATTQTDLDLIMIKRDLIYQEIESNIIDYLLGKDLATPFNQLLVMNSSFSKNIERVLRTRTQGGSLTNYEIFEIMSGFNARCKLTQNMFRKLIEHLDSKILFEFALSSELGVSITRNVVHDEYLGTIALIASETLPVLFISQYNLRLLNWTEERQRQFIQTLILYLEVDSYLHKHKDFVQLLRDTSLECLLKEPF